MKKLFYLVALFTIVSCNKTPQVGDEIEYNIIDVEYENHTYKIFKSLLG